MFGSFSAATVWRLRSRQLAHDERHGEKITKSDKQEVANLLKKSAISDRSVCLQCGRQLVWWELLPIISWLILRGKCRTCRKPIGFVEFFAELGMAASFALSYVFWPYPLETGSQQGMFVVWMAILVVLSIHWMYDHRWQLLLDKVTMILTVLAIAYALLYMNAFNVALQDYIAQVGILILILPVFYGVLWLVSKGSWVGFGDVKLLMPFSLILSSWEHGLLVIFLSNLIGLLVVLPGIATGKLKRGSRVPFGPFLIAGFIVTMLIGHNIVKYYVQNLMY
jgi:leader peptidase (prepilin peptidase)/N-methyltransferase